MGEVPYHLIGFKQHERIGWNRGLQYAENNRPCYITHNRCTNPRCDDYQKWYSKDIRKCPNCNCKLRSTSHSNFSSKLREKRGLIKRY